MRQLILYEIDFGWIALWELNSEVLGSLWLMASATSEGNHIGWRLQWLEKASRAPFKLYVAICITNEEKHGKPSQGNRVVGLLVASTLLCFEGQPRLSCWASVHHCYLCRTSVSYGRHKCVPSCRNKGFTVSGNFELKLLVYSLMWSSKNVIPKSSWICQLPAYQAALVAMRRHLGCKTCSFRTWLWAADLQIGQA
jgi:hypothetical protein